MRDETIARAKHRVDFVRCEGHSRFRPRRGCLQRLRRVSDHPAGIDAETEECSKTIDAASPRHCRAVPCLSVLTEAFHVDVRDVRDVLLFAPGDKLIEKSLLVEEDRSVAKLSCSRIREELHDSFTRRLLSNFVADPSRAVPLVNKILCGFPRREVERFANRLASEGAFDVDRTAAAAVPARSVSAAPDVSTKDREHLCLRRCVEATRIAHTPDSPDSKLLQELRLGWSGQVDLNHRPHGPEPCALNQAELCPDERKDADSRPFPLTGQRSETKGDSRRDDQRFHVDAGARTCAGERHARPRLDRRVARIDESAPAP